MNAAADNYRYIRAMVDKGNKDTEIICVVKADAYGHGAKRFAALYRDLGVKNYAVSNLDEAVELRKKLGDGDEMILILGYTDPAYAHVLCRYRLTQTVFSLDYAIALSANLTEDLPVHIKLDTGMNRLGFPATESGVVQVADALSLPHLIPDGIFTHFATADEEDTDLTRAQFEHYMAFVDALRGIGITFRMRHVCNSAATLRFPEMYLDAVRCGIILYGLSPLAEPDPGLKPVMSLCSKVVHIHGVRPGERISYGGTFLAEKPMRVATVPIGYDDGLLRVYAAECGVYIGGKFAKILGRICMDQCMVDVTDIPCEVGDEVEVFGVNQSADTLARAASSINYEVTCIVGKRVPRDEVMSD